MSPHERQHNWVIHPGKLSGWLTAPRLMQEEEEGRDRRFQKHPGVTGARAQLGGCDQVGEGRFRDSIARFGTREWGGGGEANESGFLWTLGGEVREMRPAWSQLAVSLEKA